VAEPADGRGHDQGDGEQAPPNRGGVLGDEDLRDHARRDRRRGSALLVLYWIAILFSNTLGTALGDFLADSSGLGFAGGALLIGALLALTLVLTFFTKVSRVLLFWVAFVLTRPFGATLGDVLTKSKEKGGLDLGTKGSSAVLGSLLVASIVLEVMRQRRRDEDLGPTA
jgi:uncharacterized membrane-anchored protein